MADFGACPAPPPPSPMLDVQSSSSLSPVPAFAIASDPGFELDPRCPPSLPDVTNGLVLLHVTNPDENASSAGEIINDGHAAAGSPPTSSSHGAARSLPSPLPSTPPPGTSTAIGHGPDKKLGDLLEAAGATQQQHREPSQAATQRRAGKVARQRRVLRMASAGNMDAWRFYNFEDEPEWSFSSRRVGDDGCHDCAPPEPLSPIRRATALAHKCQVCTRVDLRIASQHTDRRTMASLFVARHVC
ncbi:hypothetical protein BDV95DRAFT_598003 [Massariosphaeria phaeospora]|uniref:Uncharacterized protein n=1 Tax=Massariosphaeria phaeospora TaxID=100035 RepID=A0A7C8M3P5_9PLEO|nr:hypothetical protein BDV95DRAFT_598003 [Massariosphaeria phaeospora]